MDGAPRFGATNLQAVLDQQGRKQRWLAERAGISESLISKLLLDKHTVDRDQADRIAQALGVPFSLLFVLRDRSDSTMITELPR